MEEQVSPLRETPENISLTVKSDGKSYSVRADRKRYMFPDEWNNFYATLKKPEHQLLFLTLLNTGARIMEALHLKPSSFNFERSSVHFSVVKQRTARKRFSAGRSGREFFVPTKFTKRVKSFISRHNIGDDDYLFLNNEKLPMNYDSLTNKEKLRFYGTKKTAYANLFKRKVKKAGIKNPEEFALHNLRKTYGNWMRTFISDMGELCYRMGHDMDTFIEHYGSSLLFTEEERRKIQKIMGDVR